MFAQREGGESREAEASSPGDGQCASGTVTLREIKEEERGEGKGSCGYRGYPVSQLLFSLSPPSADYGRGRNWIGHVDTSCPKRRTISGGQGRGGGSELRPAGPTWSVQDRSNVLAAVEEDDIEIEGGRGMPTKEGRPGGFERWDRIHCARRRRRRPPADRQKVAGFAADPREIFHAFLRRSRRKGRIASSGPTQRTRRGITP